MKLILLPGNSIKNKEWIESAKAKLKDLFDKSEIQYYKHWLLGGDINWEDEVKDLIEKTKNAESVIFAKSAGIGIALEAISKNKIIPKLCIFVGTPLSWAEQHGNELSPYFKNYKTPTLFIQQKNDPYASSQSLKTFLEKNKVQTFKLIEIEGNDHNYSNLDEIRKLVIAFI